MAKWLQQLETFIGGGPGGPKRVKAFRWLVLIGLIGAVLLLVASYVNVKTVPPSGNEINPPHDTDVPQAQQETFLGTGDGKDDPFAEIETQLDSRLKEMLENIVGVGTTDVMVTVESTEETVVQLNEKKTQQITDETDKNGARRHITDVTQDGQVVLYEVSGGKSPIVVKKVKPRIRGVLIVAKGAENATVHRMIAEAIASGLDVPIHRISVVPRKL
ncbi:stage III sporulation protein AG [Cohnella nanjingensis]|uniref:Stage III sporulation protein AG n=1 Tax=Cohnella nanjingensis TaxID=1387779 RepID=A0A7X0RZN2_9BACL|nr:stage III sporulation protein AG [Cohnella nanjingensis]MBB6675240.1 stage III sporulation protein AG [Cohnella nanjingensis]